MYFGKCFIVFFCVVSLDAQLSTASCSLPQLTHGRARYRQRSKLVKFICYQHYTLVGNRYATCRNGQWDEPTPVCVRPSSNCISVIPKNSITLPLHNDAWLTFFCLPGHRLVGNHAIYCDGSKWNGTAPDCVDDAAEPLNLSCDFESPDLCGWKQDEFHDFDWRRLNTKTPSAFLNTGPSFDHTLGKGKNGYYMYIESTSEVLNNTARLLSPVYDSSLANEGCFSLYYHMYGMTTGGLRVYQKPDDLHLQTLVSMEEEERSRYLLFERWGNQGDYWHHRRSKLKDFNIDFQIVIEGIRGYSYTSDIAIDDVAIMQGANCTGPDDEEKFIPPLALFPDSCLNRCQVFERPEHSYSSSCQCYIDCITEGTCCPDFFDMCLFQDNASSQPDDANPISDADQLPQTQKLIAPTPVSTTQSSTTTTTTTTTVAPTTTVKPTTQKAVVTTKKAPTSVSLNSDLTDSITDKAKTTTDKAKTTTNKAKITTVKAKIITDKSKTTVVNSTTSVKVNKTILNVITTRVTSTTTESNGEKVSRTFENHNVYHKLVAESRKNGSTNSGLKTTLLVIGIVICLAGASWLLVVMRSSRGQALIARWRGRVTHDSEVRYLTSDRDED